MARPRKERKVEVVARKQHDLSYIPEDIQDYYGALDKTVSLCPGHQSELPKFAAYERYPILFGEVTDEGVQKTIKQNFLVRPDGFIAKGDCLLCAQSNSARKAFLEEARDMWLAQEHGARDGADAAAIAELLGPGRGSIADIFEESGGPLSSFVGNYIDE